MNIDDIKKIVEMMKECDVSDFEMENEGLRLHLKRKGPADGPILVAAAPAVAPVSVQAASPAPVSVPAAPAPAAAPKAEENDNLKDIPAPIVGTFYRAPSPDADPFVTIGQEVDEDTTVCIVEAMKVMNEIKAEMRGVIRKIMVENATPVQYGQPLFKVEPK